ncbi:hypothetical protein Bbelb_132660 [Branchiostoma belcheri]|nr:hypothetical protein Bbelb_132660 [Branchiostoma belcheri]
MRWGKRTSADPNNTNSNSLHATFHVGVQAMIVCVPAVPNIAVNYAKDGLDQNTLSLRRFQSDETRAVIEEARSCTAADTVLATQAEIHQYSNVDTSGDFEDAAPDEEEMMYAVNYAKDGLDQNTLSLRRFQSDETRSVIEEARSCTAADTALATQAEIHQYSNVDTSGDFEDAAPDEEEMMYADNYAKDGLDTNTFSLRRFQSEETTSFTSIEEALSRSTADTVLTTQADIHQYSNVDTSGDSGDAVSDEKEMMYGIATANSVYEDTNLNQSNPTPHYCAYRYYGGLGRPILKLSCNDNGRVTNGSIS